MESEGFFIMGMMERSLSGLKGFLGLSLICVNPKNPLQSARPACRSDGRSIIRANCKLYTTNYKLALCLKVILKLPCAV